ncbi:hypothetical protein PIB30_043413, partial [Stylosanthes scabra]|nr:hypothetical protein [Stylosanthes scabra]
PCGAITTRLSLSNVHVSVAFGMLDIVQEWKANKSWLPKERVDAIVDDAEKLKNWLEEKETEQKKVSGFSTPAFTSEEVLLKVFDLQNKVSSVNRIPKPKPKIQKPVKNETESKGHDSGDSNSTSTDREQSGDSSEGTSNESPDNSEVPIDEKNDKQTEAHDEL